jgi:hypothetical protein
MMDRAIASLVSHSETYGYEDGTNAENLDRNTRYLGNLSVTGAMNYPVMYQNLMTTFKVTSNMNNGYIVLG